MADSRAISAFGGGYPGYRDWSADLTAYYGSSMEQKPTIAEMIEQDPSLLNRKGVLELAEIQKLAAGPCTVTEIDAATGEVRDVWTLEGSPDVARIRRSDN